MGGVEWDWEKWKNRIVKKYKTSKIMLSGDVKAELIFLGRLGKMR